MISSVRGPHSASKTSVLLAVWLLQVLLCRSDSQELQHYSWRTSEKTPDCIHEIREGAAAHRGQTESRCVFESIYPLTPLLAAGACSQCHWVAAGDVTGSFAYALSRGDLLHVEMRLNS